MDCVLRMSPGIRSWAKHHGFFFKVDAPLGHRRQWATPSEVRGEQGAPCPSVLSSGDKGPKPGLKEMTKTLGVRLQEEEGRARGRRLYG